jgi:hypothetical protein
MQYVSAAYCNKILASAISRPYFYGSSTKWAVYINTAIKAGGLSTG